MPLYIADYLADTSRLSTLEHGAYLLLIMDYWRNGSLPADDRKLARIARLSVAEWEAVRDDLAELFLPGWRHKRIDAELARSSAKSDAARGSAAKRWGCKTAANASPSADANASPPHNPGISETTAGPMLSQSQSLSEKALPPPLLESPATAEPRKPEGERNWDLIDLWERFQAGFPWGKLMSKDKALGFFGKLSRPEMIAAVAALPSFVADPARVKLSNPISAQSYLEGRLFANYAPRPATGPPLVTILQDSPEGRALDAEWRATRGKPPPWSNGKWYFPETRAS